MRINANGNRSVLTGIVKTMKSKVLIGSVNVTLSPEIISYITQCFFEKCERLPDSPWIECRVTPDGVLVLYASKKKEPAADDRIST